MAQHQQQQVTVATATAAPVAPRPTGAVSKKRVTTYTDASKPLINWADDVEQPVPPPRSAQAADDAFEAWMAGQYKEQQLRHDEINRRLLQNANASEEARGELSMWHVH